MDAKKWNAAGWIAVATAALVPLSFVFSLVTDIALKGSPRAVPAAVMSGALNVSWMLLSLIAIYRFRELLNERYRFHGIDTLVTLIMVLGPIMALVGTAGRIVTAIVAVDRADVSTALMFAVPIVALGVLMGIVSILIGAKLLAFDGDIVSLVRPYAILSIAAGACFVLVVLVPLGMLFDIAALVVLALIFFRAAQEEPSVDFV